MSRETEPREWLRVAEVDHRAAKHLLDNADFEACAFHCQQAVEKLLKAIIVKQTNQRPPYVHDLLTLLRKVGGLTVDEEIAQAIGLVDGYYAGSRYPLDAFDPDIFTKPLAESAVRQMDEVFQWFLTRITFDDT